MKSLILALAATAALSVAMPTIASADPDHHDRGGHDSRDHGRDRGHGYRGGYQWRGHSWGHRSWVCRMHYGRRSCTYRYW